MKKYYFTFGQIHTHSYNGKTLDKDCVVEISADSSNEAREKMFGLFGQKWGLQYDSLEKLHLEFYPKGITKIK